MNGKFYLNNGLCKAHAFHLIDISLFKNSPSFPTMLFICRRNWIISSVEFLHSEFG